MNPKAKKYLRNLLILASLVGVFWAVPFTNIVRFYPEYRGLVVDRDTSRPIEKAQVIAVYEYAIGSPGGPGYSYLGSFATWTDAEGKFRIPARPYFRLLLLGFFDEHPDVSIYKAGYAAYPSILYFTDIKGELVQVPGIIEGEFMQWPPVHAPATWFPPDKDVIFRLPMLRTTVEKEKWGHYGQYIEHLDLDDIPLKVRQKLQKEGFVFKHARP